MGRLPHAFQVRLTSLTLALLAWFATAAQPAPLTKAEVVNPSHDPQLAKVITVSERRIRLGELFEDLSKRLGVTIVASDRNAPISGYLVSVYSENRPAGELLSAIRNLFNTTPDPWYWVRQGTGEQLRFILESTISPERAWQQHQQFTDEYILALRRSLARLFAATPQEKNALLSANPELKPYDNPRTAAAFPALATLSDQDLVNVLHGTRASVPLPTLTAEQRLALQTGGSGATKEAVGQSESTEVVRLDLFGNPTLVVRLGSIATVALLGGGSLARAEQDVGVRGWVGSGDRLDVGSDAVLDNLESVSTEMAGSRDGGQPRSPAGDNNEAPDVLRRLARAGHISIVLDLPPLYHDHFGLRLDRSLHNTLVALSRTLLWKERDGFYLFRVANWMSVNRSAVVPWPVLRELRAHSAANAGYLTVDDWVRLADLREEQLVGLIEEFPDAAEIPSIAALLRLYGQMDARERQVARDTAGIGWSDLSPKTQKRLLVILAPGDAKSVRIVFRWDATDTNRSLTAYFGPGPVPHPRYLRLVRAKQPN